jgi:hypothetical protein
MKSYLLTFVALPVGFFGLGGLGLALDSSAPALLGIAYVYLIRLVALRLRCPRCDVPLFPREATRLRMRDAYLVPRHCRRCGYDLGGRGGT